MRRNPAPFPVKSLVRCGGRNHRILLTKKGKLVLLDHPHLEEDLTLAALTGEKPRCLEVLEAWRKGRVGLLPQRLKTEGYRAKAKRYLRRREKWEGRDPLRSRLKGRLRLKLEAEAWRALKACSYEGAKGAIFVEVGKDPHIEGAKDGWHAKVRVHLPLSWLLLWRRGLATALSPEGKRVFVLALLEEGEAPLVLAGWEREKDYSLRSQILPRKARAFRKGGEWRLEWL